MPPVDIFQTGEHELVLKAELPDMTREDIDITVENGTLTHQGREEVRTGGEGRAVPPHRAALRHVQPVVLAAADASTPAEVAAEYKNGVLTVRLPLREEAKPRQIKVEVELVAPQSADVGPDATRGRRAGAEGSKGPGLSVAWSWT